MATRRRKTKRWELKEDVEGRKLNEIENGAESKVS